MSINYTKGIPFATHNPSDDQPIMQQNNDANFQIWDVDHIGFDSGSASIPSGTHATVTFPETQPTPTLLPGQAQIFPQTFASSYLETYTSVDTIAGNQINGYLPFVKMIVQFVGLAAPGTIVPVTNALIANVQQTLGVYQIIQAGTGSSVTITINFATALPFNTYFVFADALTNGTVTYTKNTTTLVLSGSIVGISGKLFNLMVI